MRQRRYGVTRQTVHDWLRRYANEGFSALVDKLSRSEHCPHQMPAVVEASIVDMPRAHLEQRTKAEGGNGGHAHRRRRGVLGTGCRQP